MRVKNSVATKKRRKKWLDAAEGTWGVNHKSYRNAKQTVIKSSQYAYRDRRNKKRDFRKLWIARINAAVRKDGYKYSSFINELHKQNIQINRKMLSELAINHPEEFSKFLKEVMKESK